jgi:hypothetical protein
MTKLTFFTFMERTWKIQVQVDVKRQTMAVVGCISRACKRKYPEKKKLGLEKEQQKGSYLHDRQATSIPQCKLNTFIPLDMTQSYQNQSNTRLCLMPQPIRTKIYQ